MPRMSGAAALVESLAIHDVDFVFGMLARGDIPIAVDLTSPDFVGLAGTLAMAFDAGGPTLIHFGRALT